MSDKFLDRLNSVVNQLCDGNWAQFSKLVNIPMSTLQSVKKGVNPGFDKISRIPATIGVSLDWLATGEGPMFRDQPTTPELPPDEAALLDAYRAADEPTKAAILVVAKTMAKR